MRGIDCKPVAANGRRWSIGCDDRLERTVAHASSCPLHKVTSPLEIFLTICQLLDGSRERQCCRYRGINTCQHFWPNTTSLCRQIPPVVPTYPSEVHQFALDADTMDLTMDFECHLKKFCDSVNKPSSKTSLLTGTCLCNRGRYVEKV